MNGSSRPEQPFIGPRRGRPRRRAILDLVPPGLTPCIDVGSDHGYVARVLDAIATERRVHRLPEATDLRRVVADGLLPFRRVGVAVLTGIGAGQIGRILERGPRPRVAVLHAPDRPDRLRRWCAAHGWRIDAERLAPEARGFAEITRVVPGREPHDGRLLAFGPKLLDDPHLEDHSRAALARWRYILHRIETAPPPGDTEPRIMEMRARRAREARGWIRFLESLLAGWRPDRSPAGAGPETKTRQEGGKGSEAEVNHRGGHEHP